MLPGKRYKPEDLLAILWRRKWVILIPFAVITMGTVAVVSRLPDRYRSETLILVEPQRVPENYVRPTVTTRIENRLPSISQQILSRTRLEGIITELDLYPAERRTMVMEDVVDRMRDQIKVDVVKGDSFRVAFVASSPTVAMKVTQRLASAFIDENTRDRANLAEDTEQFLGSQLEDARRRLVDQEKKLEAYRRAHSGELPTQLQSNLTALNNTQMQIQSLVESINRDRDRKQLLERTLADAMSEQPIQAPVERTPNPPAQPGDAPITSGTAAQQLEAAQQALRALQTRLTPEHPDVVRMKRAVEELQKKADAEAAQQPVSPDAPNARVSPAEQQRRKRLKDMQLEIDAVDRTIKSKEAEEQRLRGVAGMYQARADAAPTRETELIELTRDYSTLQQLYSSLLAKSEESKIAANLETRQVGETFKMIDPARLPEKPFSPDRSKLNMAGGFGGLALGLLLAMLLEYRDTSLKTDDDVVAVLSLPVLAMIPNMVGPDERRRERRRFIAVSLASAITLALAVTAVLLWVRRP